MSQIVFKELLKKVGGKVTSILIVLSKSKDGKT
jgi:hypothetical protein